MSKLDDYEKAKMHLKCVRNVTRWRIMFSGDKPENAGFACFDDSPPYGKCNMAGVTPIFMRALNANMQAIKDTAVRLATEEVNRVRAAAEAEAREVLAELKEE